MIIFEEFSRFVSLKIDKLKDELDNKQNSEIQLELDFDCEIKKLKDEFVDKITHDIKQPLVSIIANAELLKLTEMGELNDMQKESVNSIISNANHQLSMINDLVSTQKLAEVKNK